MNNIKTTKIDNLGLSIDEFKDYYLKNNYNENVFNKDGSINLNYNSKKKTGLIAQIFEDHWFYLPNDIKQSILKYKPNADKEINKIIDCHNKNLGCSVYKCPDCGDISFIGHTCKSRFCSSCGYKYKLERVEYVTRYCDRVAISENRILNYDGNNVTFCYNDHTDNSYHEVTVTATQFITILLRHLLPENFKIIRYYGFYRKKHSFHDKIIMMISNEKKKIRKTFLKYEIAIQNFFKYNPFDCPKCGQRMIEVCYIEGG